MYIRLVAVGYVAAVAGALVACNEQREDVDVYVTVSSATKADGSQYPTISLWEASHMRERETHNAVVTVRSSLVVTAKQWHELGQSYTGVEATIDDQVVLVAGAAAREPEGHVVDIVIQTSLPVQVNAAYPDDGIFRYSTDETILPKPAKLPPGEYRLYLSRE